jgi:ATP/maltotriose-dependent transcriptional regulator MalT
MATPLLTTKLYIPPPLPNLVERPRLIERLNEGLPRQSGDFARKLILVALNRPSPAAVDVPSIL